MMNARMIVKCTKFLGQTLKVKSWKKAENGDQNDANSFPNRMGRKGVDLRRSLAGCNHVGAVTVLNDVKVIFMTFIDFQTSLFRKYYRWNIENIEVLSPHWRWIFKVSSSCGSNFTLSLIVSPSETIITQGRVEPGYQKEELANSNWWRWGRREFPFLFKE